MRARTKSILSSWLRAEIRRLFRYLKSQGVTAVATAEQGDGSLTRHSLEEYVSDCVVQLDHRVSEQTAIRRLRVVKYRGSRHGTNEYPFLIEQNGISVLPITSMGLDYEAPSEQIPSGRPRLYTMLGGGFFRGSSILVAGTAATGKTSIAAHFAYETCRRGERCLYFAFEESPRQIVRNMNSIGMDLTRWLKKGLLKFHSARPSLHGLEMHLGMCVSPLSPMNTPPVIQKGNNPEGYDPVSDGVGHQTPIPISVVDNSVDNLWTHLEYAPHSESRRIASAAMKT